MSAALKHRGPDSAGQWQEDETWLAHRRLAILDLSPQGHQPMQSPCGRYILVFNGEVYNYRSLRSQLEAAGQVFRSRTDTEVVLLSCITWGIQAAARKFEGMFAFGLYDKTDRILYLVRDPMGIKPLYYAHSGNRFAFSSELRPLLRLPWISRSINQDALFSYFQYRCVPSPESILTDINKIPSGSILKFSQDKAAITSFWHLPSLSANARKETRPLSLQQAADRLEDRLRRSVRMHMQSDVPYGAFLSGGIDSSTVVALMQAESSCPVRTFSVGFAEKTHDESAYAAAVARHLGTDHHQLILEADKIPELIPAVVRIFDEPFADNSAIPTYLLSRFARNTVKVCLSGDGGDELFGGYPRYFWARRIERLQQRLGLRGAKLLAGLLRSVPAALWNHIVDPLLGRRYSGSEGLAYRIKRLAAYLAVERRSVYRETMSTWADPSMLLDRQPTRPLGADACNYPDFGWAEEMMLIDQQNYLQDDILTKVDRTSMAVSLESRVPLLIPSIVDWSWHLDPSLKLADKGDRGKLVLREVLYRHVPAELIERPKYGFGMPVGKWLRGPLKAWAESLLDAPGLEACGLRTKVIDRIWKEHQKGADRQAMIWTVLMYRQWFQTLSD